MRARQSLPLAVWPLTALACLAFGGLALLMGMDAGWELRAYEYYNGWAFLNGVVGRDLAVAGPGGFLNPTANAAYVLLAETLPAPVLGFIAGMLHAMNVPLLFAISWRMLDVRNPNRRMLAAGALALAGGLGSAGLSLLGSAFLDNLVAVGILAAMLGIVGNWEDLADGDPPTAAMIVALAGVPAGIALGLKPSMAIFAIGLALAFPFANMPIMRRLWLMAWFLSGLLVGTALGGGHWMAHLWSAYGNPFFPFLNHIFLSPWANPEPYLDHAFRPATLLDALTLPYRFAFEPGLVTEAAFRDYRTLAVVVLVPLAGLVTALKRDRDPGVMTLPGPSGFVMAAALISVAVWAMISGRYRHLAPLEMLAPLVVVAAIGALPLPRAARRGFATAIVAFIVVTTLPGGLHRVAWEEKAVSAAVPALADEPALVVLTGAEEMSFLIPSFPKQTRFVHLDSGLGFGAQVRDAIAGHSGPILALHAQAELAPAMSRLAESDLRLDLEACAPVTSPIGQGAYTLCPTRPKPAAPVEEPVPALPDDAPPPASDGSADSSGSPGQL